jgi:glutamate dehydrogenase (NAD(P)+)
MSSNHASNYVPSYLNPDDLGPWGQYLQQVDRVTPYLGSLARWVETLKRPKRILTVDVPIERDDGTISTTCRAVPARAVSVSTRTSPCRK